MISFVLYDPATGEIKNNGVCKDTTEMALYATAYSLSALQGEGTADINYVDINPGSGTYLTICMKMDWTPVITGNVVTGFPPAPCYVYIEGIEYPIPDGSMTLTCNYPGTYQVMCEGYYHMHKIFEVVVP